MRNELREIHSYPESLKYLSSFSKQGASVTDLTRFSALAEKLGSPEKGLRCIHVAGTNGKGSVTEYIADIGEAVRNHPDVVMGISTRGLLALKKMSQGIAAVRGGAFVTPDDVQKAAGYVIPHRLICRRVAKEQGSDPATAVAESVISRVKVPTENT